MAHQGDGPVPTVRVYGTDRDEATGIARSVRAARRPGGWWSEIAVLARTHAQTVIIEEALTAAGIPCRLRNGHLFLRRPEVQLALDGLAARPSSFRAWVTDLEVESRTVPGDGPAAEERRGVLAELVRFAREFAAGDQPATAEGFLGWLSLHLRTEGPSHRADAVDVGTFHAAKGLEWPTVFLAGMEDGLVPLGSNRSDAALAEERRLLYVALTRAERGLHLSWARTRTFGTRSVTRSPSPWLAEVDAARAALTSGAGPDLRARVAEARRSLRADEGGPEPEVLDALRAWRSAAARAAGVPAYLVLHDATLLALAEARPRTRAGLLELPGLGPVRTERFGDALLDVLARVAS
jgi:DNA helicase-2/ATP-dependent DNA helicase PcrA